MKKHGAHQAAARVFVRPVNAEDYPAGLANSIHIACKTGEAEWKVFNRNYGILFAEGLISGNNTIIPMGIRNPGIFQMDNGIIGICAERIHENGDPDETSRGRVLLWTTRDLIHFESEGLVDRKKLVPVDLSDSLALDSGLAEEALRYWSPIVHTGTTVPETVHISSAKDLEYITATLQYSDGSARQKRVIWETENTRFGHPGTYVVRGTVEQQHFRFPLAKGYGDPVIFPWEGKWYYISTNDNLDDIGLYIREAPTVEGLFADGVKEHLILPFSPERGFEQTFWAPEFHVIGGELFILFAVSGHTWGPQCHMMKRKPDGKMTDADGWEDPVRVVRKDGKPLADDAITLDMTFLRTQSGSYMVWSYREHIGTPLDSGSMLYIASVDEKTPWQLTSEPVLLTRPLYGWENVEGTINNEGPCAFIRDGIVYLTYSGGSANRYTYALGLMTACTDSDLLDIRSWSKSVTPVLTFRSVDGEYGPGHNSFFTNEDGELMIAYHAETGLKETLRCDGIRRVHFRKDHTPYFGMSPAEDLTGETVTVTVKIDP